MKHLLSLLLTALFSFVSAQSNTLIINGKTNVNSFKCTSGKLETLTDYSWRSGKMPGFVIPVSGFDCGGKMITSDFRKTLKSDVYPSLNVRFLNLKKLSADKFQALAEVKLMGNFHRYTVNFELNGKYLYASQVVKFSDFDLVPPKRMGGMVVVKDDLNLNFILSYN